MNSNFIADKIDKALTAAGLRRGLATADAVRATIDKALAAAGLMRRQAPGQAGPGPAAGSVRSRESHQQHDHDHDHNHELGQTFLAPERPPARGRFLSQTHRNKLGTRDYKLYIPSSYTGAPMPLVLMLHGCKQDPDDFAAGTQMNELAEQRGFLVAYPAQSASANGSNCWNWFDARQQSREGAEPGILAGIVAEVAASHAVRADQVFVAGLSAGAAMAVILGRTHPEVFAGVAAHSGLPAGAAHDVASAFAAMRGSSLARSARGRALGAQAAETATVPRTIVLHGSADATVKASNGEAIVAQAVASFEAGTGPMRQSTRQHAARGGAQARAAQVAVWADESGTPQVEHWVVEGGTHAWFGGDAEGSYTDPAGPNASAEIVRFFMQA